MATSIWSGTALMLGYALIPRISSRLGFTGHTAAARVPQALQEEAPEAPFLVARAYQRHRLRIEYLRQLLNGLR